jgi:hypothetical protein
MHILMDNDQLSPRLFNSKVGPFRYTSVLLLSLSYTCFLLGDEVSVSTQHLGGRVKSPVARSFEKVAFDTFSRRTFTPHPIIMANLDLHVASVLDAATSDDEDALIASLEDSPALDAFREQRIQQLHSELARAKAQKNEGFGNYTEIKEEKALMDLTTEVKYAVVHFAKDDFARCGVMDGHLEVRIYHVSRIRLTEAELSTETFRY